MKKQPTRYSTASNTRPFPHPYIPTSTIPFSKSPKPHPHLASHSHPGANVCLHVADCSSPMRAALTPLTPRTLPQWLYSCTPANTANGSPEAASSEALDPEAGLGFCLPCPQPAQQAPHYTSAHFPDFQCQAQPEATCLPVPSLESPFPCRPLCDLDFPPV